MCVFSWILGPQDRRLGHGSSQQSQGMSQCVVPPISSVYRGCEAERMRMLHSCCGVLRLGLELLDFVCYCSVWQCALPTKNTRASPSWAQKCLKDEWSGNRSPKSPLVVAQTLPGPVTDPKQLPKWNYDGSSTGQAPGEDSEVIL
jgi:hypothetical protein